MGRDVFDLGKNIINGIFSGATFLDILAIIGISVAGMLLRALLERLKETNPRLANLIAGLLLVFAVYLIISHFIGDNKKSNPAPEENIEYETVYPVDSFAK